MGKRAKEEEEQQEAGRSKALLPERAALPLGANVERMADLRRADNG